MPNTSSAIKWIRKPIALTLLLGMGLALQPAQSEMKKRSLWKTSVAALVAASIADAHSSWNRPELNPLVRTGAGRFGGRSIAIKGAVIGSTLLLQHYMLKRNPTAQKATSFTNFAAAGVLGGVAIYNHRLHSGPRHAPGTPVPAY